MLVVQLSGWRSGGIPRPVECIGVIRDHSGLGLRDSKELFERFVSTRFSTGLPTDVPAPSREAAEQMVRRLRELNVLCELRET